MPKNTIAEIVNAKIAVPVGSFFPHLDHVTLLRGPSTHDDIDDDTVTIVGVARAGGFGWLAGDLLWYRYNRRNGNHWPWDKHWDPASKNAIGTGWSHFRRLTGRNGYIFGLDSAGDLHGYFYKGGGQKYDWGKWGSPFTVGGGFDKYVELTCGADFNSGVNILWGITAQGELYRSEINSLSTMRKVADGWGGYRTVFAGDGDALFAVTPDGNLLFFPGKFEVTFTGPGPAVTIGRGWDRFSSIFSVSTSSGIEFYATTDLGETYRYVYTGDGVADPQGDKHWLTPRLIRQRW